MGLIKRLTRGVLPFGWWMLFVSLTGCSMPNGMNNNCEWPAERPFAANLRRQADRQHLANDIKAAEELAIRFTDAHGKLSRFAGQRLRDCEAKLFATISMRHNVTLADVGQARKRLDDWRWDPAVHIPVAAFCVAGMAAMARRIRRRFSHDEWAAAIIATLGASVVLGISIVFLGQTWHGVVEMIRVGDTHMSYRAFRLGWRQYSYGAFAVVVLSFWFFALVSYRLSRAEKGHRLR